MIELATLISVIQLATLIIGANVIFFRSSKRKEKSIFRMSFFRLDGQGFLEIGILMASVLFLFLLK